MLALPLLLAAQTSLPAAVPFVAGADQLYEAFKSICVDSSDIQAARTLARNQPGASPVEGSEQPPSYRVYKTSQLTIGVLGNPRATCYVHGIVNTDADVERVTARLAELRGSSLRIRSRDGGQFRYANWGPRFQPYHFESKRLKDGHFQVLISLGNKKAD